jgi:F-type H+-transporting ATPase subunit gamma
MPNPRKLDRRRRSIRNIRKITRTMELIATARFKKAMDRAAAATAYTKWLRKIVGDLLQAGLEVRHPLLETREKPQRALLLVLTANRGLCGGYNGSVVRLALPRLTDLRRTLPHVRLEVSGKRGISAMKFRGFEVQEKFTQFEDQPQFADVERIADRYLETYTAGHLDRLDVAYVKFLSHSRQAAVVETLLPLAALTQTAEEEAAPAAGSPTARELQYEFLPSAESILAEIVPTSFKACLFKCFLDAAVSEQIARMTAMKAATDNASEIITLLSRTYNRARQTQITKEIMEVIGGAEALNK